MFTTTNTLFSTLLLAPLAAAHGKTTVFTGDLGGNGTALGIKGASVANVGQNYQTEPDTTIFWSKSIKTDDDFGYTDSSNGNLGMADLDAAMSLSGSTLPQVSVGGSINATLHVVTSDGAGPFEAIVDPTATGKFSEATDMEVTTQVPGTAGWIDTETNEDPATKRRSVSRTVRDRVSRTVGKRQTATLVNKNYNLQIALPANVTCSGTYNGMTNLCAVKISNNNENGPFGSVLIVQQPGAAAARRAEEFAA